MSDLTVLNVVVSTPEARGGAVRAGLQLGDSLGNYATVDNVKMAGNYDTNLYEELDLVSEFLSTPSRTLLRDVLGTVIDSKENIENTVIWTELSTPQPLNEYDLVHIHNAVPLWGLLATSLRCRFAGVPYVMTTHGISKLPDLPENTGMSRLESVAFEYLFLSFYWNVLRNASHLFALSEQDRQTLSEHAPARKISVVPNGVSIKEVDTDRRASVASQLGIDDDEHTLLFVGKIMESKGISDLLDAYDMLPDCRLVVVGPPKDDDLVARLNEYDPSDVSYLGYTDRDTLDALFEIADLFVFPTRADVFPLVTLEAMSARTPVVTTRVGGLPEQVSEDTGVLTEPGEPQCVAQAVERLIRNETEREAASAAALERVENNFSWDTVASQTAEIYTDILKPHADNP